jgi:hypothetical protein
MSLNEEPNTRLDEYTEDEWFEVCRNLKPGLTREEFKPMWEEFVEKKRQRLANLNLQ